MKQLNDLERDELYSALYETAQRFEGKDLELFLARLTLLLFEALADTQVIHKAIVEASDVPTRA